MYKQLVMVMDPRDALDETFKRFELKAADIANVSGIDAQMISKYRNKHKDMNSLNLLKIVNAMPPSARFYFFSLLSTGEGKDKSLAVA